MGYSKTYDVSFWEKVDRSGGPDACWPWTRLRSVAGYGRFRQMIASRVAYGLTHGELPSDRQVCHKCDNPPCCNPAHLFLGTAADNAQDMAAKGRSTRGDRNRCAALTDESVAEMRRLFRTGRFSVVEVGRAFGVTQTNATHVLLGNTWKHVPGAVQRAEFDRIRDVTRNSGARNPSANLSNAQAQEIRALAHAGAGNKELAERFGVTRFCINAVVMNKTFRDPAYAPPEHREKFARAQRRKAA